MASDIQSCNSWINASGCVTLGNEDFAPSSGPGSPEFVRSTSREQYPAVEVTEHQSYVRIDVLLLIHRTLGSLTVDLIRKGCNGFSGPKPGNPASLADSILPGDVCGGARTKLLVSGLVSRNSNRKPGMILCHSGCILARVTFMTRLLFA